MSTREFNEIGDWYTAFFIIIIKGTKQSLDLIERHFDTFHSSADF